MRKKTVAKNYIYNLIYQILVIIIPIITTPYLSRVLGAAGIGTYSYTLSIATYFVLFGTLGISLYGQREIAYLQNDENKRSKLFWEIIILRIITMLISMVLFYFIYVNGSKYGMYYKILLLELVATMIDISWFFQGMEEFKKTVTRNLIVKLLSVISIFLFVKTSDDIYIYLFIFVISTLIGNLSLWFYLPKYVNKADIKKLNIVRHLKPILMLFLPQIAIQVYTVMDKTMIGYILDDMRQVGFYEQSQKIIKVALTIVTSAGTVMAPRIASVNSKNDDKKIQKYLGRSFNFVWVLATPLVFGIIATATNFIPWFLGMEYLPAIPIIMIGSFLIIAIGLNNVSGMQYLIPTKRQDVFTKTVIIGAIINFILNMVLIPKYKAIGAIFSSVIAEIVIFIAQLMYIKKDIKLSCVYKNCLKPLIISIVMFIIVYIIGKNLQPGVFESMLLVVIGAIIYLIGLIVTKEPFFNYMLDRLLRFLRGKFHGNKKNN